ncbi:MAG TPA: hypothetical protein VGI74_00990 [Streptosporangiaceae bacterium]
MVRKLALWLTAVAGGVLIAGQWPDIRRYVKIKSLSMGDGHPENVPAGGRTSYPQRPEDSAPEGTGDFDAARRGGPAQ